MEPNMFEKAKSLLKAGIEISINAKSGILADEEVKKERLSICESCIYREDNKCNKCGCNLKAKTSFKQSFCPLSKWGKV